MEHAPTSCSRIATRVLQVGGYMLRKSACLTTPTVGACKWLISRMAFDGCFSEGALPRHGFCVDFNNSKEDHPPLRQHICLMSKQSGWFPLAKKLRKISFFLPGAFRQPQSLARPLKIGLLSYLIQRSHVHDLLP